MQTKKKYLSLMLAVAMLCSLFSFTTSSSAATAMQSYVSAMQPGWNLGNTLDAIGADETSWGNRSSHRNLYSRLPLKALKAFEFR